MKRNYQNEMEKELSLIVSEKRVPKLVLHSCCAPCSSYVIEYLSEYFDIDVIYYNPNIYPREEYFFREGEQQKLIERMDTKHPVRFIKARYLPEEYYSLTGKLESEREGGLRCSRCFELRLEETAKYAASTGADYFTTTLTISPHKNAEMINAIGEKLSFEYGVRYLFSDFKKRNGFKRSVELTREYGMYRQDYCGCEFTYAETIPRQVVEE